MAEANVFFLPVKDFCRRPVVTCSPDDPLVEVGKTMRERNISSVVVCKKGEPAGIVTDRDLRNKVVARGEDPRDLTVRTVMSSPLQVVREEELLFEALHRMSRHGIHRVGVVDAAGRLTGIITDSDIVRLQTRSPYKMVRDIEEAGSLEDLREIHSRVQGLVAHLSGTGVPTTELVRMIALLNDKILLRLIALLRTERFPDLPEGFAFFVLGSEGRREQTLTTDQDNAIVYADDLGPAEVQQVEAFSRELIDALIAIGVPPCPGGIMARNATWRRSLEGWTEVLKRWFSSSTPEHILNASMFLDFRTIYGDSSLEQTLKEQIIERLRRDSVFLLRMAENVLRFQSPLGWFGRIKVEREGEHRGLLDIKKAGIFAITEGVKVLALEAGEMGGGTRERIRLLAEKAILTPAEAEDLEASFNFLVILRLRGQVAAIREGREPGNHIDLDHFNRMEKGRLKLALEGVGTFQGFLKRHFRLDLIR
jgi:CBS domain-containing protein